MSELLHLLGEVLSRSEVSALVGLISAIAAIVAIFIPFFLVPRRRIDCEIISDTAIVSTKHIHDSKINILFNNSAVKDVRLIILRLKNSGNSSIDLEEFQGKKHQGIELEFLPNAGQQVQILDAEILKTRPSDLKDETEIDWKSRQNYVILKSSLLRSKDWIEVKITLSEFSKIRPHALFDGRIQQISKQDDRERQRNRMIVGVFAIVTLFLPLAPNS